MPRKTNIVDHDTLSLQRRIGRLHYEKANMRLWKEKLTADTEAEIQELTNRVHSVTTQLNSARQSNAELAYREQNLMLQLDFVQQSWQELKCQERRLSAQLDLILSSLSWRVTEPLRSIAAMVRSIRRDLLLRRPSVPDALIDEVSAPPPSATEIPSSDGRAKETQSVSHRDLSPEKDPPFAGPSPLKNSPSHEVTNFLTKGKFAWDSYTQEHLRDFHDRDRQIAFPIASCPSVSIVIVSYNNPHLLLFSLLSILNTKGITYEVIIVDNASDSDTQKLLERVQGAAIVKNSTNRGFPAACMQGVASAVGTYLCFLNNDAILEEHCLSTALAVFTHRADAGAVGARILQCDGQLQEAGGIVWCDGTTNGYGCGDNPAQLRYLFQRPVDYCSGAFLVTPRVLFNEVGGFDEGFSPGYYEDTDYCMRLWSTARSVVYEPRCIVHHYGNAGSRHKGEALSIVIRNHEKFYQRWAAELSRHQEPYGANINAARFASSDPRRRALAVVDQIPHARTEAKDSWEWRALRQLSDRAYVTCAAVRKAPEETDYLDLDRSVELVDATTDQSSVIRELVLDYDLFWFSNESSLQEFYLAVCNLGQLEADVELAQPSGVRRFSFDEFLSSFGQGAARRPES